MSFAPTPEQSDITDAFKTGETVVVEALAGTGKTTTLKLLAESDSRRMTYVAFNRAIADEAARRFPRHVTSKTMHSFAFAAVGRRFSDRLNGPRVPAWQTASILRIPGSFEFGSFSLRDRAIARLAIETVNRFCHSAAEAPSVRHIPTVPGMNTYEAHKALCEFLMPFVDRAWADLQDPAGRLKFSHDVYLKLWAMGDPKLPGEVVLFDEAQDADPVIRGIVEAQAARGAQLVIVGDANQQIYEWRGAVNALDLFEAPHRLPLQKSFRFGPVIAEQANLILEQLDTDLRLEGHEPVGSQLAVLDDPDAVLCRTNAEAVATLMEAQVRGIQAGLVGGTQAVESLARAAQDLMRGEKTYHPDLVAFDSWAQVQEYVKEDKEARDLAVLVKLVDSHGPEVLLAAVERAVPESVADLVISTAHKAKGREWDRVRVAGDFVEPRDDEGEWNPGELRLSYVTVTRAKRFLDATSMDWLTSLDMSFGSWTEDKVLKAEDVPVRVIETIPLPAAPRPAEQVICDPESTDRLIMHSTKWNPDLVDEQKRLSGRAYRGEYCGYEKVNIVRATHSALRVAEKYGLTISSEARARVEEMGLA